MRISPTQYAEALLLSDSGDPKRAVSSFLAFVRKRRAMRKLPEIVRLAEKLVLRRDGRLVLSVETAHEPEPELRGEIERIAAREFPEAALSFEYRVRPELLGGVRIVSDDAVLDATIRRRLNELGSKIKES